MTGNLQGEARIVSNNSTEPRYQLRDDGVFAIADYNSSKTFSSFFPGLAGKLGTPMWTFYVNRGQCVCSLGIEGKHKPIMEFLPANWAYNLVSTQGFRTFVKFPDQTGINFYEPFQNHPQDAHLRRTQRMLIAPAQLTLEEDNLSLGLSFRVEYFNIPQASYAGLARRLTIRNLNPEPVRLQVLDGLPLIVPYGLDDFCLKHMRRLFEAFAEVTNIDQQVPFYKLKVEPADRPDVVRITKGNFYFGFGPDRQLVSPVYDPVKIFGGRADYLHPENFISSSLEELTSDQHYENRLPCAMGSFEATIAANRTYTYTSVIGHARSATELNELVPNIIRDGYLEEKAVENQAIVSELTQRNFICSSQRALDQYARQNFLDNVLRGGFPHTLQGRRGKAVLHLYSRKHGDLERDYNDYRLTPTPYSQGNGNFRDVNQNRRSDVWFNPEVGDGNVRQFYDLIQLDGFNPLVIKELRFAVADPSRRDEILAEYLGPQNVATVGGYLAAPFTPGDLMVFLNAQGIAVKSDPDAFIGDLLSVSAKLYGTEHAEGYWTDHWTYNLDLLENYLALYPERRRQLLFDQPEFSFYDDAHRVQPRDDRYVVWEGRCMQLEAVVLDPEKEALIRQRGLEPNKVRTGHGNGEIYHTTLFAKLLSLVANKLSSLDPEGVGVEMEAGKPGWYDALNGLPGLIGSSLNETLELKRQLLFLLAALAEPGIRDRQFSVFTELGEFISTLQSLLASSLSPFEFWDRSNAARESFRASTRLGIDGTERSFSAGELSAFIEAALRQVDSGIAKAWDNDSGVIGTYFIHEVVESASLTIAGAGGNPVPKLNHKGLPCFRALKFRQLPLPLFLEGPVHYLRCAPAAEEAARLARSVRASALFDPVLKMYKVNESLASQPMEIGRARTFSPGWFENESVWLHMEYKYMLELLRNGLYTEFYRDFQTVFVPFLDPAVYGRSILENSSFIVSSANPDPSVHGNGFVARLSGATAEFISILNLMALGPRPFELDPAGKLQLNLKPALPAWLFTTEPQTCRLSFAGEIQDLEFPPDSFSFMFLGEILVTYRNPSRKDTFGPQGAVPAVWKVTWRDGSVRSFETLCGDIAEQIRDRRIDRLEAELR